MTLLSRLSLLACLMLPASWAAAQPRLPGVRLDPAPTIDGKINPEEWTKAATFTEFVDDFDGQPAPLKIQIWIGYTDEAIYFAGRVEKDPKTIRAVRFRPNQGTGGDDRFSIGFDARAVGSSRDNFAVNGNRGSSISLAGGRAGKIEWIGEFDSQGRVTETGFESECRIPWKLLSDLKPGKRDINLRVEYDEASTGKEYTLWKPGNDANLQPKWIDIEVPLVKLDRSIKVLGYGYAGASEGQPFESGSGLDFKIPISTSLTGVGTINPDFRNIQNAILGIDFSYLDRLAGENRPFFDEGSDYFPSGIFASQRIREIDTGFKLYGQVNNRLGLGVLTTVDYGDQRVSVISARGSTPSQFNYTLNFVDFDVPGRRARAVGLSASQRIGAYSATVGHNFTDDAIRGYGTTTNLSVNRGGGGWNFNFGWRETSANYFARAGFTPENNFRRYALNAFRFAQYRTGPLRSISYGLGWSTSSRLNGDKYTGGVNSSLGTNFRNNLSVGISRDWSYFQANSDQLTTIEASYPSNNPDRYIYGGVTWGILRQDQYSLSNLGIGYKIDERMRAFFDLSVRRHTTDAEQLRATVNYDLDAFQTISARMIYDQGLWNYYVSYRLSGRVGNEYFLIIGDPAADQFRSRIALKVTIPWAIKF